MLISLMSKLVKMLKFLLVLPGAAGLPAIGGFNTHGPCTLGSQVSKQDD